jgi:hypothetical protein
MSPLARLSRARCRLLECDAGVSRTVTGHVANTADYILICNRPRRLANVSRVVMPARPELRAWTRGR